MNNLPNRISPCPIREAVVEIRYKSNLPSEAIFGIIYDKIFKYFGNSKTLPIKQLPEAVISRDPKFRYYAHYILSKENLKLKVGPRVLTFSNTKHYIGWEKFFEFVNKVIVELLKTDIIQIPERIGVRYINLFEYDILDKTKLELSIHGREPYKDSLNIRTEHKEDKFVLILNYKNNVNIDTPDYKGSGSIIDIDCIYNCVDNDCDFTKNYKNIIKEGHQHEKSMFFGLLEEKFIQELNPEYNRR